MKNLARWLIASIAGTLIVLLAVSFASATFAQTPGDPSARPGAGMGNNRSNGRNHMGQGTMTGPADSLVGMAAAELGINQADLVAQLGTTGTIADALIKSGSDPATLIDRFVASRGERLDAAVAAGTLTRAEADARLATARSMSTARIYQPFTALGPGGQGTNQHGSQGSGFVDENGDAVCDLMPSGGRGSMGSGRGPRR